MFKESIENQSNSEYVSVMVPTECFALTVSSLYKYGFCKICHPATEFECNHKRADIKAGFYLANFLDIFFKLLALSK